MSKLAIPKHLSIKEFMTEESEFLRDATRGFVDGVIMPTRQQVDADEREHKIIEPILKQVLADFGAQRLMFPEKYGGLDVTSLQEIHWAAEELARGDSGMAVAALCTTWPITPTVYEPYRREDLLKEFAKIFCGKETHFACFAMTEPQGGCDIENVDVIKGRTIRTTAELDGDEWVINGEKQWASNSRISSLYLTVCTTDPDLGEEGIALIYVPAATKGLDFSDFEIKAGMAADRNCSIYFDNVRVPKRYRVAGPGDDAKLFRQTLVVGNLGSAGISVGTAQNTFEIVTKYTTERVAGGKPIKEHSITAIMLADMAIGIETARTYALNVARMFDHPKLYGPRWSSEMVAKSRIAKVYAADVAVSVTNKAMELMGSNGYSRPYDVEKHWRDVKITQQWLGGSIVGRLDIARHYCKLETI
ncbi:MAG: acyl-CoA dehydrogenase family protein [Candidatus Hermodarchaeia archaeon]|jgi:alkylation response protein AidB-like acyl-CoA dehydrogenase